MTSRIFIPRLATRSYVEWASTTDGIAIRVPRTQREGAVARHEPGPDGDAEVWDGECLIGSIRLSHLSTSNTISDQVDALLACRPPGEMGADPSA